MKHTSTKVALCLVFVFLLGAACNNSSARNPQATGSSSGRCSDEAEFRDMITRIYVDTSAQYKRVQDPEVDFKTFTVGAATRYLNPQYGIDASPAYPVTTDYTVREYFTQRGVNWNTESDYRAKYTFYLDYKGDCARAQEYLKLGERRGQQPIEE